jgi:acetyl-CoA synthetase
MALQAQFPFGQPVVWQPNEQYVRRSRLKRFMERHGLGTFEGLVGAKLNIVHNCLDKWMDTPTQNRVAVRWEGEEGTVCLLTYRDLYREVNRLASAMRDAGLGNGDFVGLYMPMMPEIVIALLAIAKAVRFVGDLPRTRNAKLMRRVIRAAYLGESPGDMSALVSPEAMEEIQQAA